MQIEWSEPSWSQAEAVREVWWLWTVRGTSSSSPLQACAVWLIEQCEPVLAAAWRFPPSPPALPLVVFRTPWASWKLPHHWPAARTLATWRCQLLKGLHKHCSPALCWAGMALYEWLCWAWLWMLLLPPICALLYLLFPVLLTAPRSARNGPNSSDFVGSSFLFSWRPTVSKSGSVWALNCGTSSFHFPSSLFSFSAILSHSLSSEEKGQISTWWFSGQLDKEVRMRHWWGLDWWGL